MIWGRPWGSWDEFRPRDGQQWLWRGDPGAKEGPGKWRSGVRVLGWGQQVHRF